MAEWTQRQATMLYSALATATVELESVSQQLADREPVTRAEVRHLLERTEYVREVWQMVHEEHQEALAAERMDDG